uniref:Aa_trans domain-containing protein n=2 Tax=Ascaris TaxID=6251 RepID=A0A0M3HWH1_ASCLU
MKKRVDEHRELLLDDAIDIRDDLEVGPSSKWPQSSVAEFSQWPHIFNLTNCIVGVSVLAMPYCLQQCGILLGTILIAVCSLLTKVTCHLLYKGAMATRRRSYEALGMFAFGSGGRRVIEMLMLLYLMSTIVSFMVVIGDIGPHVLADYLQLQAPTQRMRILVMVFVFLFVILPLSLVKNLDSLSVISSVTVFFYFLFVIRMLKECIPRIFDGKWSLDVYWWRQEGLLNSLPIISMALSCQTQMFCVADCIKDPATTKVDTIVSGAVNICSAIYAAVGLFGYVAFHDKQLHGDILLYLHPSLLTQLLKLAFMLSIAVSVPLMLFPCRSACYNLFLRPNIGEYTLPRVPALAFLVMTVVLLLIDLLVAVLVPNVEFILGLTGALIGSLVTIIIPSVLFIAVCPHTRSNESLLLYAKVSVVVGALMLVGSTWAVLHTERQSNVVDVILPKQLIDIGEEKNSLKAPEGTFKENESAGKLNDTERLIGEKLGEKDIERKKEEIGEEARKILAEMKEQRREQDKMIKEQQKIVRELNEHHKFHVEEEHKRTAELPMTINGSVYREEKNILGKGSDAKMIGKREPKEIKRREAPNEEAEVSINAETNKVRRRKDVNEKSQLHIEGKTQDIERSRVSNVGTQVTISEGKIKQEEILSEQAQLGTEEGLKEVENKDTLEGHIYKRPKTEGAYVKGRDNVTAPTPRVE